MINVITLDDENLALDNLDFILKKYPEIKIVLSTTHAQEVLEYLDKMQPDLIFADISMPEINGMEIAEKILEKGLKTKVIFITAHEQYALDAFRVNAIDYILKPITNSKIQHALQKLNMLTEPILEKPSLNNEFRIIGIHNNRFNIIRPEDGQYIKMVLRELILVTADGEYTLKHSISYWEENLKNHNWFRCHKGYLVNINHIEAIHPMFNSTYILKIKGQKEEIPVSRTYIKSFRSLLDL